MGYFARRRENKQKLRAIKVRVAEILPLCEKALGVTLEKPLKIEASSRRRHKFRYYLDLVVSAFSAKTTNPLDPLAVPFDPITSIMLGVASSVFSLGSENVHHSLFGYFDPRRILIGFNLDHYQPGPLSDYVIAHELTHALLSKHQLFNWAVDEAVKTANTIRGSLSISGLSVDGTLNEGAATFYGQVVAQILHPSFNIERERPLAGWYKDGYAFFNSVAVAVGDPLATISEYPPHLYFVHYTGLRSRHSYTGGYFSHEVKHPEQYIESVLSGSREKPSAFDRSNLVPIHPKSFAFAS